MSVHPDSQLLQRLGAGEQLPADDPRHEHLESCEACQEAVESWGRLCAGLGALESADPGPDFAASVLTHLDPAELAPETAASPALKSWALGLLAATLVAGLLAFFGTDGLTDFPALLARGIGAVVGTIAAALAVLDGLAAAIPEGASIGLLGAEVVLFALFARFLIRFAPLSPLEEPSS